MSIFLLGAAGPVPAPAELRPEEDTTGITQTLLDLITAHEKTKITAEDYQSTSLKQIITFGTPAGYRIKLRYLEFGLSLVEALKLSRTEELRKRLIELVQWSRRLRVRAEAIITLARFSDPSHKRYFKSALLDSKVGIRFAAVEALQIWRQDEALDLLKNSMVRDWSPLMRVFAAQAVLSMGDQSGLEVLFKELNHDSWVVRAMAARYLGDYADPNDYKKLVARLKVEDRNDFVITELAIAALKLISQTGDKVSYSPFAKGWKDNEQVNYQLGKDSVIEVEPLVIIPPRLRIPASLQIAATINNKLLIIIKERLSIPLDPIQAQDPVLQDLNSMLTPSGFALKLRYSELSYLTVMALGGTTDPLLRRELENLAETSVNPLVKATALLSLAFNRDPRDLFLIQDALRHDNALVRMGALEAVEEGRFKEALPQVSGIAFDDPSPALRVYAMQVLAKFDDPAGRQLMLTMINDPDWPARAMAFWFLGRFGQQEDYSLMLTHLPIQKNPFVQAEVSLSALRLSPVQ